MYYAIGKSSWETLCSSAHFMAVCMCTTTCVKKQQQTFEITRSKHERERGSRFIKYIILFRANRSITNPSIIDISRAIIPHHSATKA